MGVLSLLFYLLVLSVIFFLLLHHFLGPLFAYLHHVLDPLSGERKCRNLLLARISC
jgi:hypothetical protein